MIHICGASWRSIFPVRICRLSGTVLKQQLFGAVWVLTGHRLDREEQFKVNRYNKGRTSGGIVSCRFWLETAIPLLWQRQTQLKPRKFWQFGKK